MQNPPKTLRTVRMQSEAMEAEAAACGGGGGAEAGGGKDDGLWVPEEYMEASFAFQSWRVFAFSKCRRSRGDERCQPLFDLTSRSFVGPSELAPPDDRMQGDLPPSLCPGIWPGGWLRLVPCSTLLWYHSDMAIACLQMEAQAKAEVCLRYPCVSQPVDYGSLSLHATLREGQALQNPADSL